MPRPGPRPYECVRRAWHSDRHHPIRGSIIQQIFRVVTEAHSSPTRKNREWKEKLPIVVLRAEEIIYSKANSEAEYMNLETLWERVNDAVDTIIRRDESSETGDLLPPCVEAALNLGCTPVRASRSQRQSNPRSYLTPRPPQDPPPASAPLQPNKPSSGRALQPSPVRNLNQPNYPQPEAASSSYRLKNVATDSVPGFGSVYPLYYGSHYPAEKTHMDPGVLLENPNHETILVGTPVGTSTAETPPQVGSSLQGRRSYENPSNNIGEAEPGDRYRKRKCDLSLRLGRSSEECESTERSSGNAGSSYSQEFCFFPRDSFYRQSAFK